MAPAEGAVRREDLGAQLGQGDGLSRCMSSPSSSGGAPSSPRVLPSPEQPDHRRTRAHEIIRMYVRRIISRLGFSFWPAGGT